MSDIGLGLGLACHLDVEKKKLVVHQCRNKIDEAPRNKIDEALVHSTGMLLKLQYIIDEINEQMVDRILDIEYQLNERCKPLYHRRNEITKTIPHFWRIVFSSHPVIQPFLKSREDLKILNYLVSLEVEEFKDGRSGYSITFNFNPNPYFEDKELTKTFTFLDKRTTEITATPIKWKDNKARYVATNVKKQQKIRPMVNQSFFTWFSVVEQKEIFQDFQDEIADSIKEDLWPNPLSYFQFTVPLTVFNFDGDIVDDGKVIGKGEVENNEIDDPHTVSFERVLEIQGDIHKIKKEAEDKVLEVEQWHNEMCKPAYYERNEIIKNIPDFWSIAFLNHPVLTTFIRDGDEKIFKHLTSLEVEGTIDDVKLGYTVSFNFEPNEYFDNTKLTKTYTFIGKETKVTATPVKWKDKKVYNVSHAKILPGSDVSFFMWFNVFEDAVLRQLEIFQDLDDKIAISIKEDLWPNPLSYFYTAEGGRRGSSDATEGKERRFVEAQRGSTSSGWNRERAIKLSTFLSEAQKIRSLEGNGICTGPAHLEDDVIAVVQCIQKHREARPIERKVPFFRTDMKLVSKISFGRPIFRSFSKMLSEYYTERFGVDLEVLELLDGCCVGDSFSPELAQSTDWFHVNFKAVVKDDDDDSPKTYFAELAVLKFRLTFLQCHLVASFPVPSSAGNSSKCLLKNPFHGICHPILEDYDDRFMQSNAISLDIVAFKMIQHIVGNKTRKDRPLWVFLSSPLRRGPKKRIPASVEEGGRVCGSGATCTEEGEESQSRKETKAWFEQCGDILSTEEEKKKLCLMNKPQQTPCSMEERGRGRSAAATIAMQDAKEYLCLIRKTRDTKMSKHIPVPKTFVLSEEKRKATRLLYRQEIALAMAKRIENYGKPRPAARNLLPEDFLMKVLPRCYKQKYGGDLEAVSDLRIQESAYRERRRVARWFHINFNAKLKLDDGGGDPVMKLYFAEVVKISVSYPPIDPSAYIMTVCAAIDTNDHAGIKCGICNNSDLQICHPSPDLYDSEKDPSKFGFWNKAEVFVKKKYPLDYITIC